jgi:predicted RNase H-like nuclease (RuvC/YqgF family)
MEPRCGVPEVSTEQQRIKELQRELRELRRTIEILKFTRPSRLRRVDVFGDVAC